MPSSGLDDARLRAVVDLIGRMGAQGTDIRYSDDEDPVVWFVVARFAEGAETAAALEPVEAGARLLNQLLDGGRCAHCTRPTAIDARRAFDSMVPLSEANCWYVYDRRQERFVRSCEGWAEVDRNDPCVCGSGRKFKQCHGNPQRRVPSKA